MISEIQIRALDENEYAYLAYCLKTEWDSLNMGYEFKVNFIKFFKNNSIQHLLNKYSFNLTDDNKKIIINILNKLEDNL